MFVCQAETMITAIKETFRANLPKVKWMDSETKVKAVEKVHDFLV